MAQYATTTDLAQFGLPAAALANVSTAIQNDHLAKAGGLIDSYLRSRYTLPLASPYPSEIIRCNVIIAAYDLIQFRGYNPDEFDGGFGSRYRECLAWLAMLAKGTVSLDVAADATTPRGGRPRVYSAGSPTTHGAVEADTPRGW